MSAPLTEDRPRCFPAFSSTARSWPPCRRSSLRWRGWRRSSRCRWRSIPEITPPTVRVSCTLSRRQCQVVADTVAAPIEQQVNGVEDMLYMSSQSSNDGTYQLNVTFKVGTDLNMAQVLVQNRVNLAMPTLPDVVKQIGVTTIKRSPDLMMIINLVSPDGRYDQLYLSNYALIQVRDELARLEGVGDAMIFGQRDYSMRVWLDPDRLAAAQPRPPATWSRRCGSRTCRWPPARSASSRPPRASPSSTP